MEKTTFQGMKKKLLYFQRVKPTLPNFQSCTFHVTKGRPYNKRRVNNCRDSIASPYQKNVIFRRIFGRILDNFLTNFGWKINFGREISCPKKPHCKFRKLSQIFFDGFQTNFRQIKNNIQILENRPKFRSKFILHIFSHIYLFQTLQMKYNIKNFQINFRQICKL